MAPNLATIVDNLSPGVTKVYVPDTNVLIDEHFAPFILSGNQLPDPESNSRYMDIIRKTRKRYDNSPNDVVIYEIVQKELDRLRHNPKKMDIESDVSAATRLLLQVIKEGDFKFVSPDYSYSVLENGAKIHYISHDDKHFESLGLFDPNNDDRIIMFVHEINNKLNTAGKKGIFVTNDIIATTRAYQAGLKPEPFEFTSVSDPNQLYSGVVKIALKSNDYERILGKNANVNTPKRWKERFKPRTNEFLETDTCGVKRFFVFAKEGEYIRSLKNYSSFMDFLKNPDLGRIEEVFDSINNKKSDVSDVKSRIFRLLDKYRASLPERDVARYKSSAKSKRRTQKELSNIESEIIRSLERNNINISLYDTKRVYMPRLTRFRPLDEQQAWVELCCNTKIPIRSVSGPAGSGKTFWALASGIYLFCKGEVDGIRYIKPLVGADEGLGFLKGDFHQKISPWVQPIVDDQMEFFCGYDSANVNEKARISEFVSRLNQTGIVNYDVLTYMSGRTIRREFLILDETHFIKRKHVELAIGRIGRGTYLNFLGDPKQAQVAEKRYVDEKSCGSVIIPDRLKGEELFGHISLPEDVVHRSAAARLASRFYK